LARDQRFHKRRAGLDLKELYLQPTLGGEAALVDHRDESCITLGFKDAMLPDFLLSFGARQRDTDDSGGKRERFLVQVNPPVSTLFMRRLSPLGFMRNITNSCVTDIPLSQRNS